MVFTELTVVLVTNLLLFAASRSLDAVEANAASFPRGPGLYLNPSAVILTLAAYLGWVRACTWVDRDARRLGLEPVQWNVLVFAGGIAGLLLLWVVPIFLLAYPLMLLLYLIPTGFYIQARNPLVPPERQVWTPWHFKKFFRRHFKVELPVADLPPAAAPVRLRLRPKDGVDDKRLRRVKDSPGYGRIMDLLTDAVQQRATRVKLLPSRRGTAVEFLIDGVPLRAGKQWHTKSAGESAVHVLKNLAGFDMSDSYRPQEGGFSAEAERRRIDFRLSTPGSQVSHELELRVRDRSRQLLDLSLLGMSDAVRTRLGHALGQPRGLLIICGPADSGRTTAAFACLNEIDRLQKSVFAVEDRHEVRLPNITYRKPGENPSAELKNVMRQKPGVILVGDVPDQETAELVCQASKKQTLVLAVIQSPDAVAGLFQLLDLGVPRPDLADVLLGVLSTRLVRVLCPFCKLRYLPDPEGLRRANLPAERVTHLYRPPRPQERRRPAHGHGPSCVYCGDFGYHGRTGVFEYLLVTERIRGLVRDNPLAGPLRQEAIKAGMRPLMDEAIHLLEDGTTSVEEILRAM
jgi:general secretion pathway protein E